MTEPNAHFGFISQECFDQLMSCDFQDRLSAGQHLATFAKSAPVRLVDIAGLFNFAKPFMSDENFGVIAAFCDIVDVFLSKLGSQCAVYLNEFVDLTFPSLSDGRRAVRMLMNGLMVHFTEEIQDFQLIERILSLFDIQGAQCQTEILTIISNVIHAMKPSEESIFADIASALEIAYLTVNIPLHAAASRLLKTMSSIDQKLFQRLPPGYEKYLDDGDNAIYKGPMRTINTARIPVPSRGIRSIISTPKPPDSPTCRKVKRGDEFWYKSKPRLAKTAGFIIQPPQSLTPQVHVKNPFSRSITLPKMEDPEPDFERIEIHDIEEFDKLPSVPELSLPPQKAKPFANTSPTPIPVLPVAFTPNEEESGEEATPFRDDECPAPPSDYKPFWERDDEPLCPRRKPAPVHNKKPVFQIPREHVSEEQFKPRPPQELQVRKVACQTAKAPRARPRVQPPPNTSRPKSHPPKYEVILSDLQSSDWEKQNSAIAIVTELVDTNPKLVTQNLRALVFELTQIAPSIRSALSKVALECLLKLAERFGSEFTQFFEFTVNDVLMILLSSKVFITRLASDYVAMVLRKVNRKRALEFLTSDHKQKAAQCRVQLSASLEELCSDFEAPSPNLVKTLGLFLTDANPDVRKHAKGAVLKLDKTFDSFRSTISMYVFDDSEKKAIMSCLP